MGDAWATILLSSSFAILVCTAAILIRSLIHIVRKRYTSSARLLAALLTGVLLLSGLVWMDIERVSSGKEPLVAMPIAHYKDGGSVDYAGPGYIISRMHQISHRQLNGEEQMGYITGYRIKAIFIPIAENTRFVAREPATE